MPMYEYKCGDCGNVFEELLTIDKMGANKTPCPGCKSTNTFVQIAISKSQSIASQFSTGPARGWTRRPIADMIDLTKQIEDTKFGKIQRDSGVGVNLNDIENQEVIHGVDDNLKDVGKASWPVDQSYGDRETY